MTGIREVIEPLETELGPARMFLDVPDSPRGVLLLGHGAGGGVDAPDLVALTRLAADGIAVLRFEQPWRTAGKKVAPAPARLDVGWLAARAHAQERFGGLPLVLGGRSAGARVACRSAADQAGQTRGAGETAEPGDAGEAGNTAAGTPVAGTAVGGVVALSFPLHPPGKPESSRVAELLAPACPVLVLQGANDPFGTPAEIEAAIEGATGYSLIAVPGCAHEFKPAKRGPLDAEGVAALLVSAVSDFIVTVGG